MIELAAGGRAETETGSLDVGALGGGRRAAGLGVLLAGLGLTILPAALGLLVLWGVIR